jgi:hypothetical protein
VHIAYAQLIAACGLPASALSALAVVEEATPASVAPAISKIPETETVRKSFMLTLR